MWQLGRELPALPLGPLNRPLPRGTMRDAKVGLANDARPSLQPAQRISQHGHANTSVAMPPGLRHRAHLPVRGGEPGGVDFDAPAGAGGDVHAAVADG